MSTKDQLLERLQKMQAWKKSKKYYADKLGVTEQEVIELLKMLEKEDPVPEIQYEVVGEGVKAHFQEIPKKNFNFSENIEKDTAEVSMDVEEEIKSLEDLIEKCKIDTSKWEVQKYVQNYWGSTETPHWQVKAWLIAKQKSSKFTDDFKRFLHSYRGPQQPILRSFNSSPELSDGCLIINKQDAHFNKYDIGGRNDIVERFKVVEDKIVKVVDKASRSTDLEKIVYIVGSDQFNSEWTGCTTKGTPQQNLTHYHDSFELICNHEVRVINHLLESTDQLHILYIAGNHDEYVGWHMIKWIEAYYRGQDRITIDTSHKYRKYVQYGSTALMFNHGDAMKPQALASLFPIEFRDSWSNCENFYIFTGDKHREINADFNGVKFYGIPALSNARGTWDHKQGYTGSRAELTAFVINYTDGMDAIYKELIR